MSGLTMNEKEHREKQIEIMREHQSKVLRSTLLATGGGLLMVGLMGLFTPEAFMAMVNIGFQIKYDAEDIRFFSAILCAVGLSDIAIAAIVFKDRKRL